jgi:hypothetical protein
MGIYDLYQQYLSEAYAPKETTPVFDPYKYLYPIPQDGDSDTTGGITTLSPQEIRDRAEQMSFDATALRDENGNVIGGLTKEEQELMDQARGKGSLSGWDKFNIGSMFVGGGLPSFFQLMASRKMGQNSALEQLKQLQIQKNINQGLSGDVGGGWTQTDTGGGTVTFSGPSGQSISGYSNTAEGIGKASSEEGTF